MTDILDRPAPPITPPVLQRTFGRAHVGFGVERGATRLADLRQEGAAKIRLPRTHGGPPEAVLINTAGGLTDGDRIEQSVSLAPGATVTVTTQACEKLYRARGDVPAHIVNRLTLAEGARLLWMPQETILFENGRLVRRLAAEMAPDARLLVCEAGLLGRAAMGEEPTRGLLNERWEIWVDGRPFAIERSRIGGGTGALESTTQGPATLGGARAFATVLLAAPGDDALVDRAADALRSLPMPDAPADRGASAWNGRLLLRLVTPSGLALRRALVPALETLAGLVRGEPGSARLPKVWAL
ncbi:MAG: urease accessory protein UreD [Pseudomonadota bacterium]